MDWKEVAGRVVVEACEGTEQDVVLVLGWAGGGVARALAARVARVVVVDPVAPDEELPGNIELRVGPLTAPVLPPGVSVVAIHWTLRRLARADQIALLRRLGAALPERALLVVGDVMWSLPYTSIDEPEQYGDDVAGAPTTRELEGWVRDAGFLPDLHRFGPGVGVLVAIKAQA